jgi:hypothetical protein
MRIGSVDGVLISKVETKCSEKEVNVGWSRWNQYTTSSGKVKPTKGIHDVYLVFRKGKNFWTDLMHIDWMDLQSSKMPIRTLTKSVQDSIEKLAMIDAIATPIMLERPQNKARKTNIFIRGNWMTKGSEVQPGVPAIFPNMKNYPKNRLGFAEWIVNKQNPLTSRVIVNRFWEQLFGTGILESLEDFGSMGSKPTHPELLDWLAVKFSNKMDWKVKSLLKTIVMSATYQQSSVLSKKLEVKDPRNLLLARGPRVRLSSEQIRDQALAISGLLNPTMYGPSVRPPNPTDGSWRREKSGNQFRRAIYTYWRRTNPYPSMITFDSPQRNVCVSRRVRTNTPLQALTTLNDTVYYAAAQNIALKMQMSQAKSIKDKLRAGYTHIFQKQPSQSKTALLENLYNEALIDFRKKKSTKAELLALTLTANTMLNLDEFLTK